MGQSTFPTPTATSYPPNFGPLLGVPSGLTLRNTYTTTTTGLTFPVANVVVVCVGGGGGGTGGNGGNGGGGGGGATAFISWAPAPT